MNIARTMRADEPKVSRAQAWWNERQAARAKRRADKQAIRDVKRIGTTISHARITAAEAKRERKAERLAFAAERCAEGNTPEERAFRRLMAEIDRVFRRDARAAKRGECGLSTDRGIVTSVSGPRRAAKRAEGKPRRRNFNELRAKMSPERRARNASAVAP